MASALCNIQLYFKALLRAVLLRDMSLAVAPLHGPGHQLEGHALGSTPVAIWPSNLENQEIEIPPNPVVQSASAYSPVPKPSSTQLSGAPENVHHKPFSLPIFRFFLND